MYILLNLPGAWGFKFVAVVMVVATVIAISVINAQYSITQSGYLYYWPYTLSTAAHAVHTQETPTFVTIK